MKVIVSIDSFKGCLTSAEANQAAAGGIRQPEEALLYAEEAKKIMGDNYVNNQTFRIGASSLTDKLFSFLTL